jgi:hypothetical protein
MTNAPDTIVIQRRFRGRPGSSSRGYASGVLAAVLGTPGVDVTVEAQPPVERELTVRLQNGRAQLMDGDTVLAEAGSVSFEADQLPVVNPQEAAAAARNFINDQQHPVDSCFVCGHHRAGIEGAVSSDEGLGIFAGPIDGEDVIAAPWSPAANLADEDGTVSDAVVWAALDCPCGWTHMEDGAAPALARMATKVVEPVRAGEPYVVVARSTGTDGHRRYAQSVIQDANGRTVAYSQTTWHIAEPLP